MPALLESPMVPRTVHEPGLGTVDIFPLSVAESLLWPLLKEMFTKHWHLIRFGQHEQGGVTEIALPARPHKVKLFDGYVTVESGDWFHAHICIGWSVGKGCEATPERVSRMRQPSCAHFYRKRDPDGCPMIWGMRIYNSKGVGNGRRRRRGVQIFHVFFPNPLLGEERDILDVPEWPKLRLWNHYRRKYLGLSRDPLDQTAERFRHN